MLIYRIPPWIRACSDYFGRFRGIDYCQMVIEFEIYSGKNLNKQIKLGA